MNLDEVKAKYSETITKLIKENNLSSLKKYSQEHNLNIDKIIPKTDSEYITMLKKGLAQHNRVKIIKKIKLTKKFIIPSALIFTSYQFIKYYYIIYYYIMWEVDIRKPKVSDFILERFR
jgi:hypothetical protein